jgi:hypothetical protein
MIKGLIAGGQEDRLRETLQAVRKRRGRMA